MAPSFDGATSPIENSQMQPLLNSLAEKGFTSELKPIGRLDDGVPAVADFYPGMVFESWLGIAAPVGTPAPILDRLNREIRAVVDTPAIRQRLTELGGQPQASSPAEFRARVERDIGNLRKVMTDRKIDQE